MVLVAPQTASIIRLDLGLPGAGGAAVPGIGFVKMLRTRQDGTRLPAAGQEPLPTRALATRVLGVQFSFSVLEQPPPELTLLLRTHGAAVAGQQHGVGAASGGRGLAPGLGHAHHPVITRGHLTRPQYIELPPRPGLQPRAIDLAAQALLTTLARQPGLDVGAAPGEDTVLSE